MKIGILGTRGIPNNYGGFEQLAEYLSVGLVEKGHEVFVYNSSLHPYRAKMYKGVNLVHCYDPENKIGTAGQFIYDLNCIIDARKRKFDVLLQLGYTSSSVWSFLMPSKCAVITNMDGMEWKRSKYSKKVQRFLMRAEKWAVHSSDYLISDSLAIQGYIKQKYNRASAYIAYGAHTFEAPNEHVLENYGLIPQNYLLAIARFEPENNLETIIKGFLMSDYAGPLVLVGNANNGFGKYLKATYQSTRIIFAGPVYNLETLNNLRYYAHLYFHGHTVGGTNPSLLEAMASQALIVAHRNNFNSGVLGEDALYFNDADDISRIITETKVIQHAAAFKQNNLIKIKETFSWANIISQYEATMQQVIDGQI